MSAPLTEYERRVLEALGAISPMPELDRVERWAHVHEVRVWLNALRATAAGRALTALARRGLVERGRYVGRRTLDPTVATCAPGGPGQLWRLTPAGRAFLGAS